MSYNEYMSSEQMRVRFVSALLAWHNVTPAQLGQLLGNATATVYKKLSGERAFTTRDLEAIAEAFDIEPGLLLRPKTAETVLGPVNEAGPAFTNMSVLATGLVRGLATALGLGGSPRISLAVCPRAA